MDELKPNLPAYVDIIIRDMHHWPTISMTPCMTEHDKVRLTQDKDGVWRVYISYQKRVEVGFLKYETYSVWVMTDIDTSQPWPKMLDAIMCKFEEVYKEGQNA